MPAKLLRPRTAKAGQLHPWLLPALDQEEPTYIGRYSEYKWLRRYNWLFNNLYKEHGYQIS